MTFSDSFSLFPSGYFPFSYAPSIDLYQWRDWMVANSDNLPLERIHRANYDRPKSNFAAGQYDNYSNAVPHGYAGSRFAYATGERIIVAAFRPSWLAIDYYSAEDIDSWFKTKELSRWFLEATLSYSDPLGQGGFWPISGCSFYCQLGTDGSGEVLQWD
jgi:hypothetical protein